MPDYFQNKYRIDSHRLKGWDYRTPGWYFVTICTYDGIEYFGKVRNKIMRLSEIGGIVWKLWYEIPEHQSHVQLGEFIVMPNHVHLTVRLNENSFNEETVVETRPGEKVLEDGDSNTTNVETRHGVSLQRADGSNGHIPEVQKFQKLTPGSLSIIINHFKGAVRTWCKHNDHGNFAWQPGFHDHVVRNSTALKRINEYICANPDYWEEDRYHPENFDD